MGTRGSAGWRVNGEDHLAYNHFDSYPEGLGLQVLRHCREGLPTAEQVEALVTVDATAEPTPEQVMRLQDIGVAAANVSSGNDWYAWLRYAQGNLSEYLRVGFFPQHNDFIRDSLFCEWAYIVNLDEGVLEVYRGFQNSPPAGRYAECGERRGYYAVGLVTTFDLTDLPDDQTFYHAVAEAIPA